MLVEPKVRGFICTTAHPLGCEQNIKQQIAYVQQHRKPNHGPKKVLIIGASTGYGLASRIAAAFGYNAPTIGIFSERAADAKRTASAGWYNTAAFEREAMACGMYAKSINGDAFSVEIKQQTVALIKHDWTGGVDLVIYSIAAPRRKDPNAEVIYTSVLKPIGSKYQDKTVNILSGEVSKVEIEPASTEEIASTVKVMGGEDWALWIEALLAANVLAKGAITVAYSYIGPKMTHPIYRDGTIGKAKEHLEHTAAQLNTKLSQACNGKAFVSVNPGLVTQASAAIPVVPLYISLLYKVMKQKNLHAGCIEQAWRLYSNYLYKHNEAIAVDEAGRIRIDDLELRDDVQRQVIELWHKVTTENLDVISDIRGYREEFYRLFGFMVAGVDYSQDVEIDVKIPSIC